METIRVSKDGGSATGTWKRLASVWAVVLLWAAPCLAASSLRRVASVEEVLRQARASYGLDSVSCHAAFTLTGRCTHLGVDSDYRLTFSADGRFAERVGGPLGETIASDGRGFWAADASGVTRKLELGDDEIAAVPLWIMTGRWAARNGPMTVTAAPTLLPSGGWEIALKRKNGMLACTLDLSRGTGLPALLRYRTSSGEETWQFRSYRSDGGITMPVEVSHTTGPLVETLQVESVTTAARGFEAEFRKPAAGPADTRFDRTAPARIESVRAPSGHTLVHPLINGKDVGWFFLDTGAEAMCITPQAANAAGLPKLGKVVVSGVGGATTGSFRTGGALDLGPVHIDNLNFLELDLSFLAGAFRQKIAGVCGYDLFARCVVTLVPATGDVEIHDPAGYKLDRGRWQPLMLHEKNAAIRCRFEGGRSDVFRLDTGAGDTVSFHGPAVERLRLLVGRDTRAAASGGVGGTVAARQGTLDWFEVGGCRFEKPVVTFSLAASGSFADPYTAGNVGQDFLKPFRVVFDYGRRRIAFVRELVEADPATGGRKQ